MSAQSPVTKWKHIIASKDVNGITNQLLQLAADMAVFKLYRDDCNREGVKTASRSDLAFDMVFRNHIKSVHLAVRKQNDSNTSNKKRDVYSLKVLLQSMKEDGSTVTRKAFFRSRNIPYDYDKVEKVQTKWLFTMAGKGMFNTSSGPYKTRPEHIKFLHECFDKLANVSEVNRSPEDTINPRVVTKLILKIENATKASKLLSDKYYAHNATRYSQTIYKSHKVRLSYDEVEKSVGLLIAIADFLRLFLTSNHQVALPINWSSHAAVNPGADYIEWMHKRWKEYEKTLKDNVSINIFD